MSKKVKWHKGPPPSIGWWPASWSSNPDVVRWWDGSVWSIACDASDSPKEAAERAMKSHFYPYHIRWTDRPASWPQRSRT